MLPKFLVRNVDLIFFYESSEGTLSSVTVEHTSDIVTSPNRSFVVSDDVLHTEVLWVLKVIVSHFSFNSSKISARYFT